MSELPNRKRNRLEGYDYTKMGYYFITICTKNREHIFGNVADGVMVLNEYGKIADETWNDLKNHNNGIETDIHCIMPNHVHGIIAIVGNGSKPFPVGNGSKPFRNNTSKINPSLSEIVRQFKTFSSRYINAYQKRNGLEPFPTLWQKSFHDYIIRNETDYLKIQRYIYENPMLWTDDIYFG